MNELLKWIEQSNFAVTPVLDGKMHRFDRDGKNNGWFWGIQVHAHKTGEPFIIAKVGDWKTGEQFDFTSNVALSKDDKRLVGAEIKKAEQKSQKEKLAFQEQTSHESVSFLANCRYDTNSKYLETKGIKAFFEKNKGYGTRMGSERHKTLIAIPMRDSEGKLWGVQKIFENGKKYFIKGQRKESCFHLIPEDQDLHSDDPIYVCEGFATAVTVHEALDGANVAVAFDAGNLLSVCEAIRKENSEKPIVICADDDAYARKPDGTPYNAGKEKSESAAQRTMARVVFPKFQNQEKGMTDFNDLFLKEGIETVRKQLMEQKPERHYVRCLGHRNGYYYYTSSSNKEIVALRHHDSANLLNLMRLAYWESRYEGKKGTDWTWAADELMGQCRVNGIFHSDKIRGVGVWNDEGRTVVHLGDRLSIDNQEIDIHDIKSQFIYQLDRRRRSIHPKPLSLQECRPILELINMLHFERPGQKYFLGGWVSAARLSGLLPWRPHVWITGESGSGKSTIVKEFIFPMLGDQKFTFAGGTTEPGMRQSIKASSTPVVFDEFEPDSPESLRKVLQCIEFIRQASTDSGDIIKGTASGEAVQYKARFCAIVSAIKTLINTQADRTRFTLIELKRSKLASDPLVGSNDQWQAVQRALSVFNEEYSDRFFARLINLIPKYLTDLKNFQDAFAIRHSQRLGQQYAPIMAGFAMYLSDDALSPQRIEEIADEIDIENEEAASRDTDQGDCLEYLMTKRIRVKVTNGLIEDRTILELVHTADLSQASYEAIELTRYGIKLVKSHGNKMLFISNTNPQLSDVFRNSAWISGWARSLGRINGAARNKTAKINSRVSKGTFIPISEIMQSDIN